MTTFRETCGTLRGMLAHQAAGEAPCGWCAQAEQVARLTAEALRPTPRDDWGLRGAAGALLPFADEPEDDLPVTEEEAAAERRALLMAEVEAFEQDHPGAGSRDTEHRHLWRVA